MAEVELSTLLNRPGGLDGSTDRAYQYASLSAMNAGDARSLILSPGNYGAASNITLTKLVEFMPGAKITPASGVTVHLAEGYKADDWQHCFDLSAGGSVTGDKAPMGYVTPQHFGANPLDPAHDDRPAIEAATEYATLQPSTTVYATGYPVKFPHPGTGKYYVTRTRPIYIARTTHWWGDTRIYLREGTGVEIRAADGLDAVVLGLNADEDSGKLYSGVRSLITDLCFRPEAGATVRQGFVHSCIMHFDGCVAVGFTECGFHAHAQTSGPFSGVFAHPGMSNVGTISYNGSGATYGNANGSSYRNCYARNGVRADGVNGGSHGFVAHGNNAGTIKYYGCDAAGNDGAGFLENTTIGCEYIAGHTAQNTWKVEHPSGFYLCTKYHTADAASEPGVGVDWRNYWVPIGASLASSQWALEEIYHPSGGINVCRGVGDTSIISHYSEGGIEAGVIIRQGTGVFGGNAIQRAPWHGEIGSAGIFGGGGSQLSPIGFIGRTSPDDSSTTYGMQLGQTNGYTGGVLAQAGDWRDDATNKQGAMRFAWNDIRKRYEWSDVSNSSRGIYGVSGNGFTGTGYSGITQAYLWANGMYLGPGTATGTTVARIRTATNFAGITDANYGAAVLGDRWYYTQPVAGGKCGAVCTTAGTIGSTAILKEFGVIDP